MDASDLDTRVRLQAFAFLRQQTELHGTELPRDLLLRGFVFERQRVPLLSPQGIFKPAVLPDVPLSITTAPPSPRKPAPYDDQLDQDGLLAYRYREGGPMHRDNGTPTDVGADGRRRYITTLVQRRLHQQAFRERVLLAYRVACSICRLRHRELLDAAHILPDRHPRGEPLVSNGLALCTLHHAAFDRQVLGVRPDLIIEVREDVLREADGPMLLHGLQGFQGARLGVPRRDDQQPNREFLAERYDLFRQAS